MPKTKTISETTDIIPAMLAETIVSEYKVTDKLKAAHYLTMRAENIFAENAQFRKGVKQSGDKGRDYLEAFMRHWLAGYLFPDSLKSNPPFVI